MGIIGKIIEYVSGAQVQGATFKIPTSTVKKGSRGTNVKRVQKFLNWDINAKLPVDGVCGNKTVLAIKKWEKKYGITSDGVFGKACIKKMAEIIAHKPTPKPTPKPTHYTGEYPTIKLVKSTAQVRADVCKWAKWIAGDNDFHYGYGKHAHHKGCYFCGTQSMKKGHGIKDYEHTYCCNPFVVAAYAHGGGDSTLYSVCKKAKSSWGEKQYKASASFTNLGKPSKSSLMAGDVLYCRNGHIMLYIGDGKLAEAANGDDNKKGSKRWNDSIHVATLSSDRWNNKSYGVKSCFRYNNKVNCNRNITHGEVSDRVAYLQNCLNAYFGTTNKADRIFGEDTLKAVKRFQKEQGLVANGVVNNRTIVKIRSVVK